MKPCPNCPWRRAVEPGALGGSEPEVYIGQAVGPYRIPCHAHYIDKPDVTREEMALAPECVGAAMFRANVGIASMLPGALLRMPPDKVEVFASYAEFLAHHKRIDVSAAKLQLIAKSPVEHLQDQLARSGKFYMLAPNQNPRSKA